MSVSQARAIIDSVDWECEVFKNYSDVNLGCRQRVSSGLNWAFSYVEEAIILEDDCLPHASFFRYSETLLNYYRNDERIMAISGNNFQQDNNKTYNSYYFSKYNHVWGWASWKRAWKYWDDNPEKWLSFRNQGLLNSICDTKLEVAYWTKIFDQVFLEAKPDTWDYIWTFTCWSQGGLTCLPYTNLVSNVGFSQDATHTRIANSRFSNLSIKSIMFPLQHPSAVVRNFHADKYTDQIMFSGTQMKEVPTYLLEEVVSETNNGNSLSVLQKLEAEYEYVLIHPQLLYAKSIAQVRLGHYEEAVRTLEMLLTSQFNHAKAKRLLQEVNSLIDENIQHSRNEVKSAIQQVKLLSSQGNKVKALKSCEEILKKGIFIPGLFYLKAFCSSEVGRYEEALEEAEAELVYNPYHSDAKRMVRQLSESLKKSHINKIPSLERSWATSLPYDLIMSFQKAHHNYSYRGIPLLKNPFDFSIYPLLIWSLKPQSIIEIGSKTGASALWLGDLLNNFGIDGHIYSIDIVKVDKYQHQRVTFMEGNGQHLNETLSSNFLNQLPHPLLVIDDADHTYETSHSILSFFHAYLNSGDYIVIEDGMISDMSQDKSYNSGPHKALKQFLFEHTDSYEIDSEYCDFFGYNVTWCTNGFLKKISG